MRRSSTPLVRQARRPAAPDEARPPVSLALALRHPAFIAAALVAAVCAVISVSFPIGDPDLWQHLAVGRAMWQLHEIPKVHLWTWTFHGSSDVLPSWGFRALLWPFFSAGGILGLFAWRWLTTLGAFGAAWAAARTIGARGLSALVVITAGAVAYRSRSQVRPETLVAVLLALQLWLLERRRHARPAHPAWLVAIAWLWANVHLSYYLGLVLLAIHAVAAREPARAITGGAQSLAARIARAPLAVVLGAAIVVSFANPFGWRALWQPFEYFLTWRHEPIYSTIAELRPLMATWHSHIRSGLLVLVAAWPLLVLWRPRARCFDVAEALTCALFTALVISSQRFSGLFAIAAAPYLARDLGAWLAVWRGPAWLGRPAVRAAAVAFACAAVCVPAWTQSGYRPGIGLVRTLVPEAAADFIERHGVRGRAFNPYYFGGYQVWRFWPDPERLPFMDVHQTGTRDDRRLYAYAFGNRDAWEELDRRHHFDYALLDGHPELTPGDRLLDVLDADSSWALVFRDDAAAVFVRRGGSLDAVADSFAYRLVAAGNERLPRFAALVQRVPQARALARAELERMIAGSPLNARAHSDLATLAWIDGDRAATRAHLDAALAVDPRTFGAHRRLGYLELAENRPRAAIRAFERERALGVDPVDSYMKLGEAWERLGDRTRAAGWYARELARNPDNAVARAALARLQAGPQ